MTNFNFLQKIFKKKMFFLDLKNFFGGVCFNEQDAITLDNTEDIPIERKLSIIINEREYCFDARTLWGDVWDGEDGEGMKWRPGWLFSNNWKEPTELHPYWHIENYQINIPFTQEQLLDLTSQMNEKSFVYVQDIPFPVFFKNELNRLYAKLDNAKVLEDEQEVYQISQDIDAYFRLHFLMFLQGRNWTLDVPMETYIKLCLNYYHSRNAGQIFQGIRRLKVPKQFDEYVYGDVLETLVGYDGIPGIAVGEDISEYVVFSENESSGWYYFFTTASLPLG